MATKMKNRIPQKVADTTSTNGNGNGKHRAERQKSEYPISPEGMDKALADLVPARQALRLMDVELTAEQAELRRVIVKYAERNVSAGNVDNLGRMIGRVAKLRELIEESIESALEGANARFNSRVEEIRSEDADLLTQIDADLAALWQEFRSAEKSADHIDEVVKKVVPAYVAVNTLLASALDGIRAERERRRLETVKSSIRSSLSEL